MTRRLLVLTVLATVIVAGCAGPQSTGTPSPSSSNEDVSGIATNEIPGIENGTLTNATALTEANGATLVETGGRLRLTESSTDLDSESTFTVGSGGSFVLTTTRQTASDQTTTIDYWGNESTSFMRSQVDDKTQYRQVERRLGILDSVNHSVERYLDAGTFTVENETADGTAVVLTADKFTIPEDGPLSDATSLEGRLVLNQVGQIQQLTITGQVDDQSVRYHYELLQPVIERVSKPAWVDDVPETATLRPELLVDVEDEAVVKLSNEGGDRVPRNATLSITTNETSATVVLDTALDVGETRYVFFGAEDGELTVTTERPSPDEAAPISSPLSVTLTTGDGATLYSGSIAWASSSAGTGTSSTTGSASGTQ